MTERQEYIAFIKERYPIGTTFWEPTCSEPYTINKNTVFRVHPWLATDYNDESRPDDEKDYIVDFTCHNAGKDTRDYNLNCYRRKDILSKYKPEVKIITFGINKTSTKFLSKNKTRCYVYGIGWTNYTIHYDADRIKEMYNDKTGFFNGYTIKDFHYYHVFQSRIKSIAGSINWESVIKINDIRYKVLDAYIGVPDVCKIKYIPHRTKSIDRLEYEGIPMEQVKEKLKYVLQIEEII